MLPFVSELSSRIVRGEPTAESLARALIARVQACEPSVQAWAWFDAAHLMAQAVDFDERRGRGEAGGPLAGLPVAVKDIIDVAPWANIVLPENGQVEVLDRSVMTGEGFKLAWENKD